MGRDALGCKHYRRNRRWLVGLYKGTMHPANESSTADALGRKFNMGLMVFLLMIVSLENEPL